MAPQPEASPTAEPRRHPPRRVTVKLVVQLVVLAFLLLILGTALYQLQYPPESQPLTADEAARHQLEIEQAKAELKRAEEQEAKAKQQLEDFEKAHGLPPSSGGQP